MLLEEGMNIKVCLLPDGDDPDSFARKHNSTEFRQFIQEHETDFIRFKTNLLLEDAGKDPIKRAELIGNLVQSISVIPEAIVRDVYIKECAQLLRVEDKPRSVPNKRNASAEPRQGTIRKQQPHKFPTLKEMPPLQPPTEHHCRLIWLLNMPVPLSRRKIIMSLSFPRREKKDRSSINTNG